MFSIAITQFRTVGYAEGRTPVSCTWAGVQKETLYGIFHGGKKFLDN